MEPSSWLGLLEPVGRILRVRWYPRHTDWHCHNHYNHFEDHERIDRTVARTDGNYIKL